MPSTDISTLSLHDALPIWRAPARVGGLPRRADGLRRRASVQDVRPFRGTGAAARDRSPRNLPADLARLPRAQGPLPTQELQDRGRDDQHRAGIYLHAAVLEGRLRGRVRALAVLALRQGFRSAAELVQMVVADEQLALRVLDPVELVAAVAMDVPAIGDRVVDRRKIDELVLALFGSINDQQDKPDWLQRHSPSSTILVTGMVDAPGKQFVII